MTIQTPRLRQNRHGVFVFRILYLDEQGQRRERQQSLNTKDPDTARLLALKLNFEHERRRHMTKKKESIADLLALHTDPLMVDKEGNVHYDMTNPADVAAFEKRHPPTPAPTVSPDVLEAMRAKWRRDDAERMDRARAEFLAENPNAYGAPAALRSRPFLEVMELYLKDKEGENTSDTIKGKRGVLEGFASLYDDNLTLASVDNDRALNWKAGLRAKGVDLYGKAEQDGKKRATKGNSNATVNHRIATLSDFYKWATANGYHHGSNPFAGLKIKARTAAEKGNPRLAFTEDDLRKIYVPATYLARFSDRPDTYWIPLMALYSGARLNEMASLKAGDVHHVDGVHIMFVRKGKTGGSVRRIPVHPALIELGFLDYAAAVQASGEPDFFPNKRTKKKGATASDKFNEYTATLDIPDRAQKVLHSLRHNVVSELGGDETVKDDHARKIVGHAGGGVHAGVYQHLLTGKQLRGLAATTAKITFDGIVDLDGLKIPDPTFSKFLADWKRDAPKRARQATSRAKNAAAKAARTAKPKEESTP
jgi:integrase